MSLVPNPSISVIMTARNAEKTIVTAVRSALIALSRKDEVLVFLDRCEDETRSRLDRIHDSRLRVLTSSAIIGRSAGRNFLARQAKGDYLAILDSDDMFLPHRFWLRRYSLKGYDMVCASALVLYELDRFRLLLPQIPRRISGKQMFEELLFRNPIVHSTCLIRRSAFLALGGYRETPFEDYDLWVRMANSNLNLSRKASYWGLYRVHENQISQRLKGEQHFDEPLQHGLETLANSLQDPEVTHLSLSHVKTRLRNKIASQSILARLEFLGLAGILEHLKRIGRS